MKPKTLVLSTIGFLGACLIAAAGYLYAISGTYGFHVLWKRGGSIWVPVSASDPALSPSMRLALSGNVPQPVAAEASWREIAPGFESGEMPVLADGREVDRILLARFDPKRWAFTIRNDPSGSREPADWLAATGASFLINGSYFERDGKPSTPMLSGGLLAGPRDYDARHGAFLADPAKPAIVDLANSKWQDAFAGLREASVSYPILIDDNGNSRAKGDDRWLANRSFVGEDRDGRIVFGTTKDAFLSLNRFGPLLAASPLDLKRALNLDGGPLACQGIAVPGQGRDFCGQWETAFRDNQLTLLRPLIGNRRWGLAMVITASPRPQ